MSRRLTPADFLTWQRDNDALLQDVLAENQRRVDDAVVRFVIDSMGHRVTLEQAGDVALKTLCGTRDSVCFTSEGIQRTLRAIGWKPPRERDGGAHE